MAKFNATTVTTIALLCLVTACGHPLSNGTDDTKAPNGSQPLSSIVDDSSFAAAAAASSATSTGKTVKDAYKAVSAVQDSYGQLDGGGHTLYFPRDIGRSVWQLVLVSPGDFVEYTDGTATLTGLAADRSNGNNVFTLEINFSGRHDPVPGQAEQRELKGNAYKDKGGPVDPKTWHYYSNFTGKLKGRNNVSNIEVDFTGPHIYDFQVGVGASGMNIALGASTWYYCKVISGGEILNLRNPCSGDLNINLTKETPPPTKNCPKGYKYNERLGRCAIIETPMPYPCPPPPPPPPAPAPQPVPTCGDGYQYNEKLKRCAPIECPTGYKYNTQLKRCAKVEVSCPKGYQYNEKLGRCAIIETVKPIPVPVVVPVPVIYVPPTPVYYEPIPVYYPPCGCSNYYGY